MKKIMITLLIIFISLASFSEFTEKNEPIKQDEMVVTQGTTDSNVEIKTNPLLYNHFVGCALDGAVFSLPIIGYLICLQQQTFISIDNNILLYCVSYPVGMVFLEKLIKNLFIHNPSFRSNDTYSSVSVYSQLGVFTPNSEHHDSFAPSFNLDLGGYLMIGLEYKYQLSNNFAIFCHGEKFDNIEMGIHDSGSKYYSVGIGASIDNWKISIDKMLMGYFSTSISDYYMNLLTNNYNTSVDGYTLIVPYAMDFWGIGIEWSKRFTIYKGLFVEPQIAYKFASTFDYKTSTLIGIFGGINLGYKF